MNAIEGANYEADVKVFPRIFCSTDVLNELIQKTQEQMSNDANTTRKYKDLTCVIDIIDLPYTMVWTPKSEYTENILRKINYPKERGVDAMMSMFHRYEDGTRFVEVQGAVVAEDIDFKRGISSMCIDTELQENINAFYIGVNGINRFLQDEGLYEKYSLIDCKKEGMLLSIENGKIITTIVSGKDRPDLECVKSIGMFGIVSKPSRPYKDE